MLLIYTSRGDHKRRGAPSACQPEPQGSAQARTPQQCSLGPRRSFWNWGRHCRRCEQSGTSRGAGGNERAQYSRSCCNITRIAITNGPSDVILNPSRPRLLQPDGPGWVPRCLCGPIRVANKRMAKLTPGMQRKFSIELAGKRATLAENRRVDRALAYVRARFAVL